MTFSEIIRVLKSFSLYFVRIENFNRNLNTEYLRILWVESCIHGTAVVSLRVSTFLCDKCPLTESVAAGVAGVRIQNFHVFNVVLESQKKTIASLHMVNYVDIVQVGLALLTIIAFGFIAFKFGFLPIPSIPVLNKFLLKVCYLCLVARNLAKKKLRELDFTPFFIGALTTLGTHVLIALVFLFPLKDRYKAYLSCILPCSFVNYLVIGIPVYDAIWDPSGNIMVSMMTLSNDLVTVPIYLVMSNIYLARRQRRELARLQKREEQVLALEEQNATQEEVEKKLEELDEEEEEDIEDLPGDVKEEDKTERHHVITAGGVAKKIILQIVTNPIIIGNILGFIWSATGWTLPTFFTTITTYLGDEVLGICLITVGGFIAQHSIIACHWMKFAICVLIRHVLMPLMSLGFCYALKVSTSLSRQCVIMTILPTGTTAFLMSSATGLGPGVSSTMIFWSTILAIPFIIVWLLVLDKLGIFVEEVV